MSDAKDPEPGSTVIYAAGGIVWRQSGLCSKIAVIHRTRYGGEWCLPKGKPDPDKNETLEEVALREVKEETGCEARITSFAGQTHYKVKGASKVVYFWNMTVDGECSFRPSAEVDQVFWMSPQEAIRRLDHREEKNLLLNSYYGTEVVSRLSISRFFRFINFRRCNRLSGSICAYRLEIERRICFDIKNDKTDRCWVNAACKLLESAELALRQNRIDEGWKCFHAAQRMEVFGLSEGDLKTKANLLRQESEKLSSWRKKATDDLLGPIGCPKNDINQEQVYQAALLRDEHYNNQAYKDGLLRTHIVTLISILVAVGLALILLIKRNVIPFSLNTEINELNTEINDWLMLVSVALFGIFGGAFSAALKVPTSTKSARIPELVHTIRLTLLRVFMGAASAIIIYIFAKSQFVIDFIKIDFSKIQPYTYYAISFAAGFSERLVLRAVEMVTKEKR